jgi:hypothetical protein
MENVSQTWSKSGQNRSNFDPNVVSCRVVHTISYSAAFFMPPIWFVSPLGQFRAPFWIELDPGRVPRISKFRIRCTKMIKKGIQERCLKICQFAKQMRCRRKRPRKVKVTIWHHACCNLTNSAFFEKPSKTYAKMVCKLMENLAFGAPLGDFLGI